MKKILFWILAVLTVVLALRILKILVRDLDRLTQFGYGYMTGLIILFLICLTASVVLGKKIFRKKSNALTSSR